MLQATLFCHVLLFLSASGSTFRELLEHTYRRNLGHGIRNKQMRWYRSTVTNKNSRICEKSKISYTGDSTAMVDVRFPAVHIAKNDEYVCTSSPVPFGGDQSFIVNFAAKASMSSSHHMLVFGCSEPGSQSSSWNCGGMGEVCEGRSQILYAWAKNALPLTLPANVGYRIGRAAGITHLVIQMHYAHSLPPGQFDCSGFSATVTRRPQKYYAGIYLLGSPSIVVPPHQKASADVSCRDEVPAVLNVFAFRTHAHDLSTVITGYRLRDGIYKMIGKGNPQWPHAFYTRVGGSIDLAPGDVLLARCDYKSNRDTTTVSGMGGSDEMCNFYMMYYTDSKDVSSVDCWGNSVPVQFPADADDLAPYPGYAGQVSTDAINSGQAIQPNIPGAHHHHHSEESDANESMSSKNTDTEIPEANVEPVLSGNLKWSDAASISQLGQVGGVAVDSKGFVHVFHRGYRTWGGDSFNMRNEFTKPDEAIMEDTMLVYNPTDGTVVHKWGSGSFFMPHGVAVDHEDNIWLTDVAMHQVMKYPYGGSGEALLVLGEKLVPGNDKHHFCKPADVAIEKDGTFYVADGYCNGRVVKFAADGSFLKSWGKRYYGMGGKPRPFEFNVVHSITLVKNEREVCAADRENGRIQCFTLEGKLVKIIEDRDRMGSAVYAITYSPVAGGVLYAVNGHSSEAVPTSGFTIQYDTGEIVNSWEPSESVRLSSPHDVAVSLRGDKVYVGQLSPHKVYQFEVSMDGKKPSDHLAPIDSRGHSHEMPSIDEVDEDSVQELSQLEELKSNAAGQESQAISNPLPVDSFASPASRTNNESQTLESVVSDQIEDAAQLSLDDPDRKSTLDVKKTVQYGFAAVIIIVLVSIPTILLVVVLIMRSRQKKYSYLTSDDVAVTEKKPFGSDLNLGKFFNKSNPTKQGFQRVKTADDDDLDEDFVDQTEYHDKPDDQ